MYGLYVMTNYQNQQYPAHSDSPRDDESSDTVDSNFVKYLSDTVIGCD